MTRFKNKLFSLERKFGKYLFLFFLILTFHEFYKLYTTRDLHFLLSAASSLSSTLLQIKINQRVQKASAGWGKIFLDYLEGKSNG